MSSPGNRRRSSLGITGLRYKGERLKTWSVTGDEVRSGIQKIYYGRGYWEKLENKQTTSQTKTRLWKI